MPNDTQTNLDRFLALAPVEDFARYAENVTDREYFGFPIEPILRAETELLAAGRPSVGYFSMEYGLSTNTYNAFRSVSPDSEKNLSRGHRVFSNMRAMDYYRTLDADHRLDLPIYSGGLGVLAGDTLKSAADLGLSLAAVGILWNKGYFKQNFWFKDGQIPEENNWEPGSYPGLVPLSLVVEVPLKRETIRLKLWKYFVYSHDRSHVIPLVLLDSDIDGNSPFTRTLTSQLYRSDNVEWKVLQRVLLGLGGMRALDRLGYSISRYHLNEGHAALAFVEKAKGLSDKALESLKDRFAYTCHTPVAAGHDRFPKKILQELLRDEEFSLVKKFGEDEEHGDLVNLTQHAMNTCRYVNAVAQKHGEVTRLQFPAYRDKIQSITNGVHSHTWASAPFAALFDRHDGAIGGWRKDPTLLKNVLAKKDDPAFRRELWDAHQTNKKNLCALLKGWQMDPGVFTIAWARRIAAYKRPSLILQDASRLLDLARRKGPLQILFAGKAHPKDDLGFTYVNEMLAAIDSLEPERKLVRVLMLENYDTYFGKLLASGVDVWLNNPLPPFEASGTSGMKAIQNGVLQLSTLDGWVVEAADLNVGWIFGWQHHSDEIGDERNLRLKEDSSLLYETLEGVVDLYYRTVGNGQPDPSSDWVTKMAHAVAAAAFFSTHRMVGEYEKKIWRA
ncbi:MAG TPA: alpha-glucan family phosphorylase [Candidatus Eisenbacteria bacterium]|nr:alpha-glucan family phosphorylase [Candidatus Eisenbacteria bacterium]